MTVGRTLIIPRDESLSSISLWRHLPGWWRRGQTQIAMRRRRRSLGVEWKWKERKQNREPKKTIIFPENNFYIFPVEKYQKRPIEKYSNSTNELYFTTYSDIPAIIWRRKSRRKKSKSNKKSWFDKEFKKKSKIEKRRNCKNFGFATRRWEILI